MKPTAGECLVIAAATVVGFALTGAVAAMSLVWRATDVDLPDSEELTTTLGRLVALSTAGPDDGGQGTRSGLGEASSGSAAKTKGTPDA